MNLLEFLTSEECLILNSFHTFRNDNFLKAHAEKFSEGNDTIRGILQRNYTETQITIKAIEDRLKDDRISNTERGELGFGHSGLK